MNSRKSEYPLKIQQLEALLRRLPHNHEKFALIEDDLSKELAGYIGEQSIEYYYSFLEKNRYEILSDIRLTNDGEYYFQIDALLLSTNFFIILEIKNISGTLYFDSSLNQMVRRLNNEEKGFLDPIMQVNHQQLQLKKWLHRCNFPQIPIIGLVIISQPSTIIKTSSEETKKYVLHAASLPEKIQQLQTHFPKPIITKQTVKNIKQKMQNEHRQYRFKPLDAYKIPYENLQKGIQCPKCTQFTVVRVNRNWLCTSCRMKNVEAHIPALKEYSLIVSNKISIRRMQDFLFLPSRYTAYRLLKNMNLKSEGGTWNRVYILPF